MIQSIYPIIIEHNSFSSLRHYAQLYNGKRVLIVCDIDNTIVTTPTDIASDHWFSGIYQYRMKKNGISAQEAIDSILPYYFAMQHETDLVLVESDTAHHIKMLQIAIPVIALTARSFPLMHRTIDQLQALDIDFSHSTIFGHETFDGFVEYPYHYHQGVIFCGHNNKGKVLFDILHQFEYYPEVIIMIDDKEKYLQGLQEEIDKHEGIEFIGIRYGYLDHKIASFDPIEAEKMLENSIYMQKMTMPVS